MPFDVTTIVAEPGYAPRDWQATAPHEVWGTRPAVELSPDLQRVLDLPRRAIELDGTDRAEALIDMMTARYGRGPVQCNCAQLNPERHAVEGCIKRMRLIQALALREIGIVGGLLGPIGVGHGKTLMDLLAPLAFAYHAQAEDPSQILCVLLVPPKLVGQLLEDYDYIGQHFKMPSMVIQGHDDARIVPGAPKLQVMPYSRLQRAEATGWMRVAHPHAVIADECHKLRDANTATTSRVLRYFDDNPGTRFAGWSGSITSKSIKDYAHLASMALKDGSPLPRDPDVVDDWSRAVDPGKNPADPGPLLQGLIDSGCCKPGENLYTGLRRRITETLGVVTTRAAAVDCDLEVLERKIAVIPPTIRELIDQALAFVRPDGEELVTAMQAMECAITIASGFHYRWIFPHNEFPRDDALVLDWLLKRKEWHKELRQKLKRRDENLDSPELCTRAAQRFNGQRTKHRGMPEWDAQKWMPWYNVRSGVHPESDSVRLDDYLVRDAAQWATQHVGIIWYQYTPFGKWLAEITGLPLYGSGKEARAALMKEKGDRSVIVSIKAKNFAAEQRYQLRKQQAPPILEEFKSWLDHHLTKVPPQQKLGQAIQYSLRQWTLLNHYLKDGRIEIDNNRIENVIRPFAVGRKNWLFSGSPRGAKAGAILYSLIETCKANSVEPYEYFTAMLNRIRHCTNDQDYQQLLPQFIQL